MNISQNTCSPITPLEGGVRPNAEKRDLHIDHVSPDLKPDVPCFLTDVCSAACMHYCNRDTVAFYLRVGECM